MIADRYSGIDFTGSPSSATGNTGKPRLMSLIGTVCEIVDKSVCFCSKSIAGVNICLLM